MADVSFVSALMLLDFVPDQNRTFEEFLVRVAERLNERGDRAIFAFAGRPSEAVAARLQGANAEYRVARFPLDREGARGLADSLRGLPIAVMTTTFMSCFNPSLVRLKRRLGAPRWMIYDHTSGAASKKGVKRILAQLRGWYFGTHLDRVLTVSEFVARRDVEQSFLPARLVKVLPNGVDLDRFRPSPRPDPAPSEEPVVLYVGQLIPEKGILTLLRAIHRLQQLSPPLTPALRLAGRGPSQGELRAFAADHGMDRVEFLGQVSDLTSLYRSATVVVIPSEWKEAFGLVVAEAMACGACVLAADIGGIPEVVGRDEEGGRLFRSGDPADLAEKLRGLLEDPAGRERQRERARARAERLFGIDGMVNGFVDNLRDVAGA